MADNPVPKGIGRTAKAALTGLSSLLNYGGNIVVGLIVTPVIVSMLGMTQYGIWVMLAQVYGYISMADINPTRVLKLTLATEQHSEDHSLKRRQVGAALIIAVAILPLFVVSGAVTAWLFPALVKLDGPTAAVVRWTIVLMTVTVASGNFTSIPGSVLRAMNLDYTAMGVTTGVTIAVGLLDVFALLMGWGLTGMAANRLLAGFLNGGIRLFLVRRRVSWFGADLPRREDIMLLFRRCAWFTSDAVTTTLGQRSELIVIGAVLGPAAASAYSLTKSLGRIAFELVGQLTASVNPGFADIGGRRDLKTLAFLRRHLLTVGSILATALSATVFFVTPSFMAAWVGPGKYAGPIVSGLLVLYLSAKLLVACERSSMGALLLIRQDSLASNVKNVAVFLLVIAGASTAGMAGVAAALLAGEALLLVFYHVYLDRKVAPAGIVNARTAIAAAALLAALAFVEPGVISRNWAVVLPGGAGLFLAVFGLSCVLLMGRQDYRFYAERVGILLGNGRFAARGAGGQGA